MEAEDPLDHGLVDPGPRQAVVSVDAPEHEDFAFDLNLSGHLRRQLASRSIYPARLQRAPEGAGQSAAGGRHEVVKSGCVGVVVALLAPVVLRDRGVEPERDRLLHVREPSLARRPPRRVICTFET